MTSLRPLVMSGSTLVGSYQLSCSKWKFTCNSFWSYLNFVICWRYLIIFKAFLNRNPTPRGSSQLYLGDVLPKRGDATVIKHDIMSPPIQNTPLILCYGSINLPEWGLGPLDLHFNILGQRRPWRQIQNRPIFLRGALPSSLFAAAVAAAAAGDKSPILKLQTHSWVKCLRDVTAQEHMGNESK